MTKLLFACATFLLVPGIANASLLKPASPEGLQIVHQVATKISREFVAQTEVLQGKSVGDSTDCETVKSVALESLSALDLSASNDLATAKRALEGASCGSNDLKKLNNKFFTATLSIRSFEDIN
jgi:hypothetical protein